MDTGSQLRVAARINTMTGKSGESGSRQEGKIKGAHEVSPVGGGILVSHADVPLVNAG